MNRVMKFVLLASLLGNLTIVYVGYKALMYRDNINYWLDKYTAVVDEFSGRHVYAEENRALHSSATVDNRVVFLGSQVISDWNVGKSFPDWEAIGRGVDSQRVAGFLLRFVPDVIELKPRAVVIEISSYNFRPETPLPEIRDYVTSMALLASGNDILPVIGTVIPPRRDMSVLGDCHLADSVAVFNHWLRDRSRDGSWTIIDFNRALADSAGFLRRDLSSSAIDPNRTGYRILTEATSAVLDSLMQASL